MTLPIAPLFNLYHLTPGRRIYALRRVRPLALAHDYARIVEAIDDATVHDREVIELDARRRRGPNPTPPSVRLHDTEVDRTLQVIDQMLLHRASRDEQSIAATLHAELFPEGVGPHVRLPQVEQVTANERVLERLESETHAKWLASQGFAPLVADLRAAHDAFVHAMRLRDNIEIPSYRELRRQRLIGQELYLRVVSEIIVACFDEPEIFAELIAPITGQNQEVRVLRRRRRSVPDIDPDSGDPLLLGEGDEKSEVLDEELVEDDDEATEMSA